MCCLQVLLEWLEIFGDDISTGQRETMRAYQSRASMATRQRNSQKLGDRKDDDEDDDGGDGSNNRGSILVKKQEFQEFMKFNCTLAFQK